MSETWFNTEERRDNLKLVCEAWDKTPFMPNACIKGAGVSCQKLAGGIYADCGFFDSSMVIPDGDMNWSNAHSDSLIVKFIEENLSDKFSVVDAIGEVTAGDLIGFQIGSCIHHLGVVVDAEEKRFIHCLRPIGVQFRRLDDATYGNRIGKIWRPRA